MHNTLQVEFGQFTVNFTQQSAPTFFWQRAVYYDRLKIYDGKRRDDRMG